MFLGTVLVLVSGCGGEPPEKEMQQAQGAIDAARAAGAPEYARDEYEAAVKALDRARQAATDRDYRQALNDALDARERAQTSAGQAADNMATARVDADRAVAAAAASLAAAEKRLAALDTAKTPPRVLAAPRRALADSAGRVQEARAAFDRREYSTAMSAANAVSKAIIEIGAQLDALAVPPTRRPR